MACVKRFIPLLLVMASALAFYEDFSSFSHGVPEGWSKPADQEGGWAGYNESGLFYLVLNDNSSSVDYALTHSFQYTATDGFVIQARARHVSGDKGTIFMVPQLGLSVSFGEMQAAGVDTSKWHEYTAVYNASQEYKVYADGRLVKTKALSSPRTGQGIWVFYSTLAMKSRAMLDYISWEKLSDWNHLTLEPECSGKADANGYVKLSVKAAEIGPDGNAYCSGLKVSALGQEFKKTSPGCVFSRYLFIPRSEVISFSLKSQEGQKTVACYFTRAGETSLAVDIVSPQQTAGDGDNLVKANLYLSGKKLYSGSARLELYDSENNLVTSKPLENKLGNFITTIQLSEGEYTLVVIGEYEGITANKSMSLSVSTAQENVSQPGEQTQAGWGIEFITPKQGQVVQQGIIPVHVGLTNPQGFRTTSPDVNITVYRDGDLVESKQMKKGPSTYFTTINATEPGEYSLGFIISSGDTQVEVGGLENVPIEWLNASMMNALDVELLTPRADVYSTNATLLARAVVTREGQVISNANVTIYFMGEAHQMRYEDGDYVYPLPLLSEGDYSVKVFANYSGYTGTTGVDFQVSGHKLSMQVLAPNAQEYLKESESVPLRVKVVDEKGDVVIGAFVTADVTEADGRTHTFQLYQSESTKTYSTVFYPNVEGVQKITFTASKPGYVQTAQDYAFEVILKKKEVVPLQVDMSTVYLVIGVIALVIILAALIKLVL